MCNNWGWGFAHSTPLLRPHRIREPVGPDRTGDEVGTRMGEGSDVAGSPFEVLHLVRDDAKQRGYKR